MAENAVVVYDPSAICKRADIIELAKSANDMLAEVRVFEVVDAATCQKANDWLIKGKALNKKLNEGRLADTLPHRNYVATVNDWFKKVTDPIDKMVRDLDPKLVAYSRKMREAQQAEQRRLEKERAEAQAKAEKEAQATGVPASPPPPVIPPATAEPEDRVLSSAGTSHVRKRWTFEVLDESLIPREYFVLDRVKAQAAVDRGVRVIPGLVVYEKESMASGRQAA